MKNATISLTSLHIFLLTAEVSEWDEEICSSRLSLMSDICISPLRFCMQMNSFSLACVLPGCQRSLQVLKTRRKLCQKHMSTYINVFSLRGNYLI